MSINSISPLHFHIHQICNPQLLQPISLCSNNRILGPPRATAAALITDEQHANSSNLHPMSASSFPLFQPSCPPQHTPASELELADPDFYKIGYVRSMELSSEKVLMALECMPPKISLLFVGRGWSWRFH